MPAPSDSQRRVLVVDDHREMSEMVADGLADRGYAAVSLVSPRQALALLREQRFDALITDLRMAELDGFALIAAARRVVPDLPVVVMTAYGMLDTASEAMKRGASGYVTKPFKLDDLASALARAMQARVGR